MMRTQIVLVLLAALSAASIAQEGEPAGQEEKVLQFNFRDASIDTVLEYLSQQTGMAVVKKVPISGKITAVSAEKIPVSQALAFVNSVLIDQQVAAIQVGNIIKVLSLENALKENPDIVVVRSPDEVEMSDRILTAIIPLEFIDASEIKKELGTLIVDKGILLINTKANALVLSDTATNVKRFLKLVDHLDSSLSDTIEVGYFKLTYASAEEVGAVIEDLFGSGARSSGTSSSGGGGRGGRGGGGGGGEDPRQRWVQMFMGGGGGGEGGAAGVIPSQDVRVSTDERSNTVIVTASKKVLEVVEGIVARLDQRVTDPLTIRVYPLAYADPAEVERILEEIFAPEKSSQEQSRGSQATPAEGPGGRWMRFMREMAGGGGGGAGAQGSEGGSTAPSEQVTITADERTRSVVVAASPENHELIKRLVEDLDRKATGGDVVRVYRLDNADAEEMQRIIEEIYGEGASSSAGSAAGAGAGAAGGAQRFFQQGAGAGQGQGGQGGRGQGGQGQGGQGQGGQGQGGGVRRQGRNQEGDQEPPPDPDEEENGEEEEPPGQGAGFIPPERNVRVTIDPRTNTLIVTGGEELDSIDQLIRRLDADPGQEQATLLVRLRNHDAEALEPILRELFEDTTTGSTGTALGPAAPGVGGLAGEVRVRADTTTNSLLFVTSTRNFSLIEKLVAELDVEPPQVLIKAYVIEVDLDDAAEFGVEGSYADQLGDDLDDEFKTNFGVQALADQEGGFTYSLAKNNADALVRAIQRTGKLDVLSAPRILVQDNQEASINIGSEVPFVTNSRLTDQGTTLNTIEYRDIGIILSVTPHVNPDGLVRMLIAPEVSEVAPESQSVEITEGVLSPVFLTNTASTTITIQHGHTILMGGLIRDRLSDSETKIPILGDIPLLGYLFKSTTTEKRKVELMILVTPYVLFRARDLPVLTDFELDQLEFIDRRHIEKVAPRVPFEILDE